jgi:hypothetical protein
MRLKKIARTLLTFAAVFAVLAFMGCPAPTDPSYGDLSGGPQRSPGGPTPIPENPDIVIYGVKLGNFAGTESSPGFTLDDAGAGTFFLGEEVAVDDITGLKISLEEIPGYSLQIKYAVTVPGVIPAVEDWKNFIRDGDNSLTGPITSGDYLVFEVTSPDETSYYKYVITYGRNGTGIESIAIAGRTFLIAGIPGISDDGSAAPVSSTTVYLTAPQIVLGRTIEVKLRQDSANAVITWAPSWVAANGNMPTAAFGRAPITNALANNDAIFIRVCSMYGDTYANYKFTVDTGNASGNAAAVTSVTVAGATVTTMGTPRGSWNANGLVDGTDINVKASRRIDAVASIVGLTVNTATWASVPNLETEPEFVALAEPQTLSFNGYIYIRAVAGNFINIYRFPVKEKPLSNDPSLATIGVAGTVVNGGTPASTWAAATNTETVELFINEVQSPEVAVVLADPEADTVVTYGITTSSISTPTFGTTVPSFGPTFTGTGAILIKATSETGATDLYYRINIQRKYSTDAALEYIWFGDADANLGVPASTTGGITAGSVGLILTWSGTSVISAGLPRGAAARYALTASESGTPTWAAAPPAASTVAVNTWLWVEVTAEDGQTRLYYKVQVSSTGNTPAGRGTPDPEWEAKYPYFVFPNLGRYELLTDSIGSDGMPTKMPSVSYWSTVQTPAGQGHLHEFVDPFHFANGNRVTNIADWENRRKELRMIVGYYQKGFMPSLESNIVDIWLSGADNRTINVRHKPSGREFSVTVNVTANSSAMISGREGKLGFGTGGISDTTWALVGTLPSVTAAQIMTLYGITTTNAITRDSYGPWGNSLLLIAIEGTSDPVTAGGPRQATEQYFYPVPDGTHPNGNGSWFTTKGPLYYTGTSTGGKQAMHNIVLAHGRKTDTRAGFVNIGDSGSGGHFTEKFYHQAGLRLDVSAQEALRLSGFSEAYITQNLAGLPDNSAGLPPRQGHARTLFGPTRTAGFYNVNPDGTLKMGQYSVRGQILEVRGFQPYGWQVAMMPDNAVGFSKRTTAGSNGGMEDTWGVPWYHVGIRGQGQTTNMNYGTQAAILNPSDRGTEVAVVRTMVNGPDTGMPPYGTAAESNQVDRRERLVRGWSPYFDAFNAAPQSSTNTTMEFPLPNGENYIEVPYTAFFSMIDGQSNPDWVAGIGSWVDDDSLGTWTNAIFSQFPINHQVDGFDYPNDTEGWQCSIPTNTYYQAMLDAPYGVQVHAYPTMQSRTNDYGSFVTWLVVDEIYKMYGEAEGNGQPASNAPANSGLYDGWDKYLYNNMQDYWWGNHSGMQGAAAPSMTAARTRHLERGAGIATTVDEAKADIKIARFRDPNYLVDDPTAYITDWHKMNFSRPRPDGSPGVNISERVARRVTPLLADFFKGEIYHNAPARYGPNVTARTYHDAAKAALQAQTLQFTGPKYKAMDWRGLLDNPEVQQ